MALPLWLTRIPSFRTNRAKSVQHRPRRRFDQTYFGESLLNAEEFDHAALCERMRVDRNGSILSILLLTLPNSDANSQPVNGSSSCRQSAEQQLGLLCRVLQGRLRLTDTPGQLRDGRVGILLPDTPVDGARHLASEICSVYEQDDRQPRWEVLCYPDQSIGGAANRRQDQDEFGNQNGHSRPEQVASYHAPADSVAYAAVNGDSNNLDNIATVKRGVQRSTPLGSSVSARPGPRQLLSTTPEAFTNFGPSSEALFSIAMPRWKRCFDIAAGSVALLFATPVIGACAAAVALTSRGPAFFTQEREGFAGQRFRMYKIRTMQTNAEAQKAGLRSESEQDGPAFKMTHDPRVTRVGRVLRKLSLDELPQLLNVLRGEMSLVGPRPLPVDESQDCLPWQRQRLRVHPGITCTWQVKARNTVSFEEWVRMDLNYLQNRSLWTDTKLLLQTAPALLFARGPR